MEDFTNENGKLQWTIQSNPDYNPEIDHIDDRYLIENNPIPTPEPTPQEVENQIQEQLASEGKQLIIKDENGDVRWRIVANEIGHLQVEVDPPDQPHIGEWLLNGQLGVPKLQDGELIIKLNGELQAITLFELKQLMEDL